jgi:hypothetical protein
MPDGVRLKISYAASAKRSAQAGKIARAVRIAGGIVSFLLRRRNKTICPLSAKSPNLICRAT